MQKRHAQTLVLAALFLALGLLLPFVTGQIAAFGSWFLPMHLPVLLCSFVCGWPYGLAVGFVVPLLRSFLFGMPPMMPTAVAMAFELAAYGACTGLLYRLLPRRIGSLYAALVGAMIAGRIVWGLVSFALYSMMGSPFTWQAFLAGAFTNALPGILIQLAIVPGIAMQITQAAGMPLVEAKRAKEQTS